MSSRESTPEPSTSAANTNQATPAALQDNHHENTMCPECQDISTECSSSCRHCFCQLCLWDWSLGEAMCPRCQRPTRHPYPQHVALYHEVQDRVYNSKQRWHSHSTQQPWSCSRHFGHSRPWGRKRRRSMRWPRDGPWQSQDTRGSNSPKRRWLQQQRRAWEDTPEEGQTPRFEWAIPASSQGSRSRHMSCRLWSQQEWSRGHRRWSTGRDRSCGWDRQQSRSSRRDQDTQTGSHYHSTRQRHWRSWNTNDRHTPRPQQNFPPERSETHQGEDSDFSRQWHRRRRTRGRSHRRGQNSQAGSQGAAARNHSTNHRRWRSWNADDRHAPRPQHDTPLRRSERHQWEDWDSSRQQHETRSQTQGRSHRRGHSSQPASQGMVFRNHFTRPRQGGAGMMTRDELQGPSRTSRSPQGGADTGAGAGT